MPATPPPAPAREDTTDPATPDLVVVHQVTVLDPNGKGWRTTVRIQDGWQGATLSHWSRGGASVPHGTEKAIDDCRIALKEALDFLPAF